MDLQKKLHSLRHSRSFLSFHPVLVLMNPSLETDKMHSNYHIKLQEKYSFYQVLIKRIIPDLLDMSSVGDWFPSHNHSYIYLKSWWYLKLCFWQTKSPDNYYTIHRSVNRSGTNNFLCIMMNSCHPSPNITFYILHDMLSWGSIIGFKLDPNKAMLPTLKKLGFC